MRWLLLSAFLITAVAAVSGQTATGTAQSVPDDPQKLLAAAEPFYDFNSPELKPWHLKATYQLYDDQGKPTEQGTYEYWWASPQMYRSTWTRPDATKTEWTVNGTLYSKESGSALRYFERVLGTLFLHPLPSRTVFGSGKLRLGLKMVTSGQVTLACVGAAPQSDFHGKPQAPGPGTTQYYCFEPSSLALRVTTNPNTITTDYSSIVKFHGHYLAQQVVVWAGKQEVFSISVGAIDDLNSSDPVLSPTADATPGRSVVTEPIAGIAGDQVEMGSLVKRTLPVYPVIAKTEHKQGVVVLGGTIGPDGKVHNLEVLASPFPLLAISAVDAVKQWEYKPYRMNGQAVEVETVINVFFSLGR